MPDHPQTRIEHDGFSAEVDEEIAGLILDLWRLGFWTHNSCQDNSGKVWIAFDEAPSAEEFLSIVSGTYDDDLESLSTVSAVVSSPMMGELPGEPGVAVQRARGRPERAQRVPQRRHRDRDAAGTPGHHVQLVGAVPAQRPTRSRTAYPRAFSW